MDKVDYDLIIIGGGPAGITAGIYAARARLNVVLIEQMALGGQILSTDWIENYPGFPEGLSGPDLVENFEKQAAGFDLNIETDEVVSMDIDGEVKKIKLSSSTITSHAVILATGASPMKLMVPGEEKYAGCGVSFCATCDAPFFRDRVVAAIGGGDTAVQESMFLSKFAKKVYLIHRRDKLRATKILQERVFGNDKIEIVWDTVLSQIMGNTSGVNQVEVKNVKTGDMKTLDVDGCFIWVGIKPNTDFLGNSSIKRDGSGFIIADSKMETSVSGVFAAGDVRNTPLRQVATAVGDAAIAAVSAEYYIENIK